MPSLNFFILSQNFEYFFFPRKKKKNLLRKSPEYEFNNNLFKRKEEKKERGEKKIKDGFISHLSDTEQNTERQR